MHRSCCASNQRSRAMQFYGQFRKYGQILILWGCCAACGCPAAPGPSQVVEHPNVSGEPSQAVPPESPKPLPPESQDLGQHNSDSPTQNEGPAPSVLPNESASTPPGEEPATNGRSRSPGDQAAVLEKANRLLGSAKSKRKAGNDSAAFLDARDAWNLVQGNKDPSFQRLAGEIRAEMDAVANRISASKKDPPSRFRTLILE